MAGAACAVLLGDGSYVLRGPLGRAAQRGAPADPVGVPDVVLAAVRAAALLCAVGAALLVGGLLGLAVGAAVGLLVPRAVRGLRTRADARSAMLLRADVPLAGDLLAAALAAGVPPGAAADAVGRAVGGPLGDALVRVARATELGATPATAWARAARDPATAALARPMVRASERGAPAAAAAARVSVRAASRCARPCAGGGRGRRRPRRRTPRLVLPPGVRAARGGAARGRFGARGAGVTSSPRGGGHRVGAPRAVHSGGHRPQIRRTGSRRAGHRREG